MTREYKLLPVMPLDYSHAKENPWGLTPHECCALRLYCKYGSAKQAWAKEDVSLKTVQWHVEKAKHKIGVRGHDIRGVLLWNLWYVDHTTDRIRAARLSRYKVKVWPTTSN